MVTALTPTACLSWTRISNRLHKTITRFKLSQKPRRLISYFNTIAEIEAEKLPDPDASFLEPAPGNAPSLSANSRGCSFYRPSFSLAPSLVAPHAYQSDGAREKGLTCLEVLIVLALIAVIVVIVIFARGC